jgi:hypothetical protein
MTSLFSIDGSVTLEMGSNGGFRPAMEIAFPKAGAMVAVGLPKASAPAILSRFFSALCCASQCERTRRRMLSQREAVLVIFQLLEP